MTHPELSRRVSAAAVVAAVVAPGASRS